MWSRKSNIHWSNINKTKNAVKKMKKGRLASESVNFKKKEDSL
jgi:hypothetical protein